MAANLFLTDDVKPPPALIGVGLDALPAIIRARGDRTSWRFKRLPPRHGDRPVVAPLS